MTAPRILLVTDSVDEVKDVSYILRKEFTRYLSHCFEAEALEKTQSLKPDLLILAFQQIETSERVIGLIKRNIAEERLPYLLVLCTKGESAEAYALYRQDLMDYFLADRPLMDPYTLIAAVTEVFKQKSKRENLKQELGDLHQFMVEMLRNDHFLDTPKLKQIPAPLERELLDWLEKLRAGYNKHLEAISIEPLVESKMRLLLVDDDDFYRETLAMMLGDFDLEIVGVDSVKAARKEIADQLPDIVLLDYQMPEQNGLEFLRALRAQESAVSLPVIMLTGHHTREIVVESIQLGASEFVVKPGDRDTIVHKIELLTGQKLTLKSD